MQLVFGVVVCGKWDLTALKNTVHELLVANYHFKWGVRSKRLLKTKDNFWHPLAWTCKSNNKKKNCYVLIKVKGTLCSEERLWYLFRIYSLFVASCDFIQSIRYDGLLKTKNDFWHPLASLACTIYEIYSDGDELSFKKVQNKAHFPTILDTRQQLTINNFLLA